MKDFLGTIMLVGGLGMLISALKEFSSFGDVPFWNSVIIYALIAWGSKIVISGFIDKAKKESGKEFKKEIEKLRNEIKDKEDDVSKIQKDERVYLGEGEKNKDDNDDPLYEEALAVVKEAGKAKASFIQRRIKIGYARAARLLDMMEERGVIGPGRGDEQREVYKKDTIEIT